MSMTTDRDEFDARLDASAPPVSPIGDDVRAELRRLQATTVRRRPRWQTAVIIGAIATLFVGGATAATATGLKFDWTRPWADDPLGSYTFTLPSGKICEQRIGGQNGPNPAAVADADAIIRNTDLQALLTDEALAETYARWQAEEPGPGISEADEADSDYSSATWDIIITHLHAKFTAAGVDTVGMEIQGESHCTGDVE